MRGFAMVHIVAKMRFVLGDWWFAGRLRRVGGCFCQSSQCYCQSKEGKHIEDLRRGIGVENDFEMGLLVSNFDFYEGLSSYIFSAG